MRRERTTTCNAFFRPILAAVFMIAVFSVAPNPANVAEPSIEQVRAAHDETLKQIGAVLINEDFSRSLLWSPEWEKRRRDELAAGAERHLEKIRAEGAQSGLSEAEIARAVAAARKQIDRAPETLVIERLNASIHVRRERVIDFAKRRIRWSDADSRDLEQIAAQHQLGAMSIHALNQSLIRILQGEKHITLLPHVKAGSITSIGFQNLENERTRVGVLPTSAFSKDFDRSIRRNVVKDGLLTLDGFGPAGGYSAQISDRPPYELRELTIIGSDGRVRDRFVLSDFEEAAGIRLPRTFLTCSPKVDPVVMRV